MLQLVLAMYFLLIAVVFLKECVGAFFVRMSKGQTVLSVRGVSSVRHVLVRTSDGLYRINNSSAFQSLKALVGHYQSNALSATGQDGTNEQIKLRVSPVTDDSLI
jgi:hypothetical protein